MTQKELKKPYFYGGAIWKEKYRKQFKDFTVTKYKKQTKINKYVNK